MCYLDTNAYQDSMHPQVAMATLAKHARSLLLGCVLLGALAQFSLTLDTIVDSGGLRTISAVSVTQECREVVLPSRELCSACRVRRAVITLAPVGGHSVQTVAVHSSVNDGLADSAVLLNNAPDVAISMQRSPDGYLLCWEKSQVGGGWTIDLEVVMQELPAIVPGPPALVPSQVWTSPDSISAFVELRGVEAPSLGCVLHALGVGFAECVQRCLETDECTAFVRQNASCSVCTTSVADLELPWTLVTPTTENSPITFVRGVSVRMVLGTVGVVLDPGVWDAGLEASTVSWLFTVTVVSVATLLFGFMVPALDVARIVETRFASRVHSPPATVPLQVPVPSAPPEQLQPFVTGPKVSALPVSVINSRMRPVLDTSQLLLLAGLFSVDAGLGTQVTEEPA
jgi:hypothetical protein